MTTITSWILPIVFGLPIGMLVGMCSMATVRAFPFLRDVFTGIAVTMRPVKTRQIVIAPCVDSSFGSRAKARATLRKAIAELEMQLPGVKFKISRTRDWTNKPKELPLKESERNEIAKIFHVQAHASCEVKVSERVSVMLDPKPDPEKVPDPEKYWPELSKLIKNKIDSVRLRSLEDLCWKLIPDLMVIGFTGDAVVTHLGSAFTHPRIKVAWVARGYDATEDERTTAHEIAHLLGAIHEPFSRGGLMYHKSRPNQCFKIGLINRLVMRAQIARRYGS